MFESKDWSNPKNYSSLELKKISNRSTRIYDDDESGFIFFGFVFHFFIFIFYIFILNKYTSLESDIFIPLSFLLVLINKLVVFRLFGFYFKKYILNERS